MLAPGCAATGAAAACDRDAEVLALPPMSPPSQRKMQSVPDASMLSETHGCFDSMESHQSWMSEESRPPSTWGSETTPDGGCAGRTDLSERSLDERMQRWQERRLARREKRKDTSGGVHYGQLARVIMQSNNDDIDVSSVAQEKGLPVVINELLGAGSFARVYKGTWNHGGDKGAVPGLKDSQDVAVKCIRRRRSLPSTHLDQEALTIPKWLDRETKTSLAFDHPNLVRVFMASVDKLPFLFVMEFCAGGNLYELLHAGSPDTPKPRVDRLSWKQRAKLAANVAAGMEHMHAAGVMHRDLKTQNVMLARHVRGPEDEVHAKVGDFGLARCTDAAKEAMTMQVGSWRYMAPEVFEGDAVYNEKVDVYSYSMVLYELVTEELPFAHDSNSGRMKLGLRVIQGERPQVRTPTQDPIGGQICRLMDLCWTGSPLDRPCFRLAHEDMRKAAALDDPSAAADRGEGRCAEARPDFLRRCAAWCSAA